MNVIIDYGLGNLESLLIALNKAGIETKVSNRKYEIENADSLILPGVGAFRDAVSSLRELNLISAIKRQVSRGKFLAGICLGMQLLYDKSYEYGEYEGLGIIKGSIEKLDIGLKVPHMGWNNLKFSKDDEVLKYIKEDDYVYFVHSYYADSSNEELIAYAEYEKKIPAVVRKGNIYGFQFHPEKSAQAGFNLLRAYGEMIR